MIVAITNLHWAVGIFAVVDSCLQQPGRLVPPHCTRSMGFDQASKPGVPGFYSLLCTDLNNGFNYLKSDSWQGNTAPSSVQSPAAAEPVMMWITRSLAALWRFLMVCRGLCAWLTCHIQEFWKFNFDMKWYYYVK